MPTLPSPRLDQETWKGIMMESDENFLERIKKDINSLGETPPLQSVYVSMFTYSRLLAMASKGKAAKELVRSLRVIQEAATPPKAPRLKGWEEGVIGSILYNSQAALAAYQEAILPAVTASPEGSDPGGD